MLFDWKDLFEVEEQVGVETDCCNDDAYAPAMSKCITKVWAIFYYLTLISAYWAISIEREANDTWISLLVE